MGDTQEREYRHAPGSRDAEFTAEQRSAFMARPLIERLTKIEETTLSSCFDDAPRAWERDTIREAKSEISRLRSELEKAREALKPFAAIATTHTVQVSKGEILTVSNGRRMCGIEADAFLQAHEVLET